VPLAAVAAALVGAASAWGAYRHGDRAVLAGSGARLPGTGDPNIQVLRNVVEEMAIAAGIPRPRVWIVDDPDPNAFATGRDPQHASIAVTSGLLTMMSRDELQGVIAHEISHVRNYDIRTMTVVAALLGAVLLLAEWAARIRWRGSSRDGDSLPGPLAALVFVVWLLGILLTPIVGQLLALAVSRRREYLADSSAAELTRNPLGLAKALRKLDAAAEPTRRIAHGTAHLCIADPLGRRLDSREGWVADLLATHPPITKRIAILEHMAYQR
jgi:heat shock protein HtpX